MSDNELVDEAIYRSQMVFDTECYVNYFLACFRSMTCKKVVYFEMYDGGHFELPKLRWLMRNYCLIGFNSRNYDMPLLQLAIAGATCAQLKEASDKIILQDVPHWEILKGWDVEEFDYNHIDLIEVLPGQVSLKLYGGRLHTKTMWDLPFRPDLALTRDQMLITRLYCINDLDQTELLEKATHQQLLLRATLGQDYGMDLRSLSDAQIAEAVIAHELKAVGIAPRRASVEAGTTYQYQPPLFIRFETEPLQEMYRRLLAFDFVVAEDGYVKTPAELEELVIPIGNGNYTMGMGGLHSREKSQAIACDSTFRLIDRDVESYYPAVILNLGIYPDHLGKEFLTIYKSLVERRLAAKRAKNTVVADSLKITINGTFGKLGSKWSIMYSPQLLFQVTITGQLSLLMLIERLEAAGIEVVSANTDGIVTKVPTHLEEKAVEIASCWEKEAGFKTEQTEYIALYSRDVNSYIAVKPNGKTKNKGAYGNPWQAENWDVWCLVKNPATTICIEAAQAYLIDDIPLMATIRASIDLRKFVSVRTVKGGAVADGSYLGKSIRWYYSTNPAKQMVYAQSGNLVPKSTGAKPIMTLPDSFPADVDFAWYEAEAHRILQELGAVTV
jgi:hypothetical protein